MSVNYSNVTVTTSPTLIIASNSNRRGFAIVNNASATIYIGSDTSLTTSNGIPLAANGNMTDSGNMDAFKGSLYGIVGSATADIRYLEWTP